MKIDLDAALQKIEHAAAKRVTREVREAVLTEQECHSLRAALSAHDAAARALDGLVHACELPGEHCEVEQALPSARAALVAIQSQRLTTGPRAVNEGFERVVERCAKAAFDEHFSDHFDPPSWENTEEDGVKDDFRRQAKAMLAQLGLVAIAAPSHA